MKSISLISTVHEECGRANAGELCAILERIQPQVVFLELPQDAFGHFFETCTRSNLESRAVERYRQSKDVELVPIDLPEPEDQFFDDFRCLQNSIENKSRDTRWLLTWHRNYVYDHGFAYLNSEHCSKIWSDIYADELVTLKELGDQSLTQISEAWRKKNDLREDEMLKNIRLHCNATSFERAVFLVGAAHRHSLIEKLRVWGHAPQEYVHWDFSCGQNSMT